MFPYNALGNLISEPVTLSQYLMDFGQMEIMKEKSEKPPRKRKLDPQNAKDNQILSKQDKKQKTLDSALLKKKKASETSEEEDEDTASNASSESND